MKTPGRYYAALAAFCALALCTGFASGTGTTQAMHTGTPGSSMPPAPALTNTTILQGILDPCENLGVDTRAVAATLQHGDITPVKSWMRRTLRFTE